MFFTPKNITRRLDVIREMKTLKTIGLSLEKRFPPAEFWKKYDAGEFGKPTSAAVPSAHKPITTFNDPAFQKWMKEVAALPAEKQVEAVVKKLQELNPGFDGKVTGVNGTGTPSIKNGVVTGLGFSTHNVTDISPMRALEGLRSLTAGGGRNAGLSDLSPLMGMKREVLNCGQSRVWDLSPLKGMPLKDLRCQDMPVGDLSRLQPLDRVKLRSLG